MNVSTLNRAELDSIFATLSVDDMAWAIKNLTDRFVSAKPRASHKRDARLSEKTWTDAGVSKPTAKQIVASLKNHNDGKVAFSGTAAEAIEFLEVL